MHLIASCIVIIVLLYYIFFKRNSTEVTTIKNLFKKSAKFAINAQQDTTPFLAVMHANYAHGYLQAIKELATEKQLKVITGIDIEKFEEHILSVQESVTQKVIQKCPEFAGNVDIYLTAISHGASNDDDMY